MTDTSLAAAPPGEARHFNTDARVPSATRLGPVHLAVTDGDRVLPVWRDLVGLTVLDRTEKEIRLGAGDRTLIVLEPGAARPVVENRTGLYHVAIHVPKRIDLARAIGRMFATRYRNSPTDHLVTETTYLWDADNNGIEMTFETPWRGTLQSDGDRYFGVTTDGKLHSGREAVDLQSMFAELDGDRTPDAPLPAGTRIGHVHVHVADLDEAMRFYGETIGFRPMMLNRRFRMGDVTLDYPPHIVAFNTWAGEGAQPAPPGSAGLRRFTIEVPSANDLAGVRARLEAAGAPLREEAGAIVTADPSGNPVHVRVA